MLKSPFTTLAAVVALSVLGVACTKEDAQPAPRNGTPNTETTPQRAIEPEEECVEQCHASSRLSGSSETKLAALDDCMMESCYNDPELEDTTVVACDAVGADKISYGFPARDRCIARSCCAAARDCAGDSACSAHLACVVRCKAR